MARRRRAQRTQPPASLPAYHIAVLSSAGAIAVAILRGDILTVALAAYGTAMIASLIWYRRLERYWQRVDALLPAATPRPARQRPQRAVKAQAPSGNTDQYDDVRTALRQLGFTPAEVEQRLRRVPRTGSLEERLNAALRATS